MGNFLVRYDYRVVIYNHRAVKRFVTDCNVDISITVWRLSRAANKTKGQQFDSRHLSNFVGGNCDSGNLQTV